MTTLDVQADNALKKLESYLEKINSTDHYDNCIKAMKSGCELVIRRIKTNLGQSLSDSQSEVAEKFKQALSTKIQSNCNAWIEGQSRRLVVFPEGTRFVSRDGNILNIVIEQKPNIRVIKYIDNDYRLSIPYVQFYIVFNVQANGSFTISQVRISCSTKPIGSLNDRVFRLPLPNIGQSLCLGDMTNYTSYNYRNTTDISAKCSEIIERFWQSQFNNDLSDNCATWLRNNFPDPANDGRNLRKSLLAWEAKSKAFPLFVLHDACQYEAFASVSSFIQSDFGSRDNINALLNNIANIVTGETNNFASNVLSQINNFNFEEENRNNAHKTVMNEAINFIVRDAYKNLFNIAHEDHVEKMTKDTVEIYRQKCSLSASQKSLEINTEQFTNQKNTFMSNKLETQAELYYIYNYLQDQLDEVAKLKAKLQQHFDEQGNVLVKPRRGRPKKDSLPIRIEQGLDIVSESSVVVGPNGETVKRKRGRPKKSSVA